MLFGHVRITNVRFSRQRCTEGKRFLYNTKEGITDRWLQRYHDMTNSAHELTTSVIEGNQAE